MKRPYSSRPIKSLLSLSRLVQDFSRLPFFKHRTLLPETPTYKFKSHASPVFLTFAPSPPSMAGVYCPIFRYQPSFAHCSRPAKSLSPPSNAGFSFSPHFSPSLRLTPSKFLGNHPPKWYFESEPSKDILLELFI